MRIIFVVFFLLSQLLMPCINNFTKENDEVIIVPDTGANINTKRIWVVINPNYSAFLQENTTIMYVTKNSVFSFSESIPIKANECFYSGTAPFYYFDIEKNIECFKMLSVENNTNGVIAESDWVTDIYPSRLYEVGNFARNIRYRPADTYTGASISGYVLGMVLSSYSSNNGSYENGYGAYQELSDYWFKWANSQTYIKQLETTYLYDYELDIQNYEEEKKERLISVKDKIDELEYKYKTGDPKEKITKQRNIIIELSIICFCTIISVFFLIFLKKLDAKIGAKKNG